MQDDEKEAEAGKSILHAVEEISPSLEKEKHNMI